MTATSNLLAKMRPEEIVAADLLDRATQIAIDLAVAGVIVLVTLWASRWLSALARGLVGRVSRHQPPDATLQTFIGSAVRYLVIIVGGVAVLQQLGVKTTSILAVLGAASLAVGLAMQGALSNVAAGVLILALRPYRVGDFIEIGNRKGTVRALDLFVTELATADNLKVVVPNGKVFADIIVNHNFHERRRADAVLKIPITADVAAVMAGLQARAEANPLVLKDAPVLVEVTNVLHDGVEIAARAWVLPHDHGTVMADLLLAGRLLETDQPLPPPPAPPVKKPTPKPAKGRQSGLGSLRSRLKGGPDRP
jgi:small conductance mechanosensitive channel